MILHSLFQLYDRLAQDDMYQVPEEGYSVQRISFRVVLTPGGSLFTFQDARIQGRPRQLRVPGATKVSGTGLNPCFLWDNAAYMLGYKANDDKPNCTVAKFEAFRDRHLELETEIDSRPYSTVCRFLEAWSPADAELYPDLEKCTTNFGVFQIQGQDRFVHDDSEIRKWWSTLGVSRPATNVAQCLITGRRAPVAATHPKVKGVAGAQTAGAAIVSFNSPAFTSYAKDQSENAPVSESAAFRYTAALNGLLDGPMRRKHRLLLAGATVAFWTDRPSITEDVFARFTSEGSDALAGDAQDESLRQRLEAFVTALRKGREAYGDIGEDPATGFYLLALTPSAARLSVRFFLHGTLGQLLDNLRRHFDDIAIKPQPASAKRRADPEFPPLSLLLRQTARERDDIPPLLSAPLLRAVLTGAPYPEALFVAVVRRIHADRVINYPRACVVRGYLKRNRSLEVHMSLDSARPDPAYRMGRLFAVLEKTQSDALGTVGASIRDRFYSAASATPGMVFPRIIRTYQHHLANLPPSHRVTTERLVQEILEPLTAFPTHLRLVDQGLFALGYYHQNRALYTKRTDLAPPSPSAPGTAVSESNASA